MSVFINTSKEDRARRVIASPTKFDVESVERKAYDLGIAKKLEDEELVLFVYQTIGGALANQPVQRDTREGVIDEQVEGSEVEVVGEKPKRTRKA